jgi:hypothetical protein
MATNAIQDSQLTVNDPAMPGRVTDVAATGEPPASVGSSDEVVDGEPVDSDEVSDVSPPGLDEVDALLALELVLIGSGVLEG